MESQAAGPELIDPAEFGARLERALGAEERARLGAHFTPFEYVARLVEPVLIEPLRGRWREIWAMPGDVALREFWRGLGAIKVLDPACGGGNFLVVCLELLARLEAELRAELASRAPGERLEAVISPDQFYGFDIDPRAIVAARQALGVGWRRCFGGKDVPEFGNLRQADALLVDWPEVDVIVGNPPFIGGKDLRASLGSAYAQALRAAYPQINRSADLALYFWYLAARAVALGRATRFGLITSNSLRQVFGRKVVAAALAGPPRLHLCFAVADHPWIDAAGSANVRIAMTAVARGEGEGRLLRVVREKVGEDGVAQVTLRAQTGVINPDLTIGPHLGGLGPLRANRGIASRGMSLHGAGFIVSPARAVQLGLGTVPGLEANIRPYRHGRDLLQRSRALMVIDLYGLAEEEVRTRFGAVYAHLSGSVRVQREALAGSGKDAAQYAREWWLFGKTRPELRRALAGLARYIVTVETAKHRIFQFLPAGIVPDNMLIAIASDDAYVLGVLSSRIHLVFARAAGGTLEDRPRYNKSLCLAPFPFPDPAPGLRAEIAGIAEALDAQRMVCVAAGPGISLTAIYNRLAAPGGDADLEVLAGLHARLDRVVAGAYGWDGEMAESEIISRLADLHRDRIAEEAVGGVRK